MSAPRAFSVVVLSTAVVASLLIVEPARAATIPLPPPACATTVAHPGAPVVTGLSRSRSSVNVVASHKDVTFTIKAKDSKQDIDSVYVELLSPAKDKIQQSAGDTSQTPVQGTKRDGTWKITLHIPRWMPSGAWTTQIAVSDVGGAYVTYNSTGGGDKRWGTGWPRTVAVTSVPDLVAPTVTSLKLSRTSVDTSSAPQKITVTVTAKDALSGIATGLNINAYVDLSATGYTANGFLKRIAGTSHAGTYRGSFTVPQWVGHGTHRWGIDLDAYDIAGNQRSVDVPQLKAHHLTSGFSVTSLTDTTYPELRDLSFSPTTVDARTHDRVVHVSLRAADTMSHLGSAWVLFSSPSGFEASSYLGQVSGQSGTWRADVTVPQCSEPGAWKVSVELIDRSGNFTPVTNGDISALHLPTTLTVQALDNTPPTAKIASHQPAAGPVLVTFSEATLWKGSVVPITVYDTTDYTAVAGTWTCKNAGSVVVGCNANGADVTTASFVPAAALTVGRRYEVLASRGIYDVAGNGPGLVDAFFKAS